MNPNFVLGNSQYGMSSPLTASNPRESCRIPWNPNFSKWIPVIPREFLAIAGALLGDGPHDPRPDLIPAHAKEFLGIAKEFLGITRNS